MNLHFHLPASEIEKKVNSLYEGVLFEGNIGDFGAWAKVEKRDSITVECLQDRIITHVPLSIQAKLKWKEALLGSFDILTPKVEETKFEITAHFTTRVEVSPDWELTTNTLGTFFWNKKPKVGVGMLKVNVTAVLQPRIMSQILAAAQKIDSFLPKEIGLADLVQQGWQFFQEPIHLFDAPPVYGMVTPKSGQPVASPVQCIENSIRCAVSVPFSIKAFVKEGFTESWENPLPPFTPVASLPTGFEEQIESVIDFQALVKVYAQHDFQVQNMRIQVKGMGIKCKKERVNTSFSLHIFYQIGPFSRKARAVVFVSCEPHIEENGKVMVKNFDMEVLTADPFVRGYLRIKKKKVIRMFRAEAQELIDRIHDFAYDEIKTHLHDWRFHPNLTLQGEVSHFHHENLYLLPGCFKLTTRISGHISIEVDNL